MSRLLIVEDEKWEREGLCEFLDWNSLGIEMAGCACNGAEGLAMAELYRPDIILTDIKMPKMDGIQMSRNIRAILPTARIVILTGYDDFQYAKQTFNFHAFAYLLKPIDKKSLEDVIFSVLEDLNQEKCVKNETDVLKDRWMDYISINKDHLLSDLLESKTELEYVHELLKISGLKEQGKKVSAILSMHQSQEKVDAFRNMLIERGIAFSFSKPFNEAVLCMDAPDGQSELESRFLQLRDDLKNELGIEVIIGIGEVVDSFAEASQSYIQAREASSFRFLAEYGELVFYSKMKEADRKYRDKVGLQILKTKCIMKKILYGIQKCDNDSALLVDDFLSILRENPLISKMLISSFSLEAVIGSVAELTDDTYKGNEETELNNKMFVTEITAQESLSQTRHYLISFLKSFSTQSTEMKSDNEDEVVRKVIKIIESSYANELDLKLVSKKINLSPYYIGSIFKKQIGKQFSQYLNDYRLDKSREILQTRKIKVCELAEAVGIRNCSYFCTLFKNRFSISPSDYKDILKGRR